MSGMSGMDGMDGSDSSTGGVMFMMSVFQTSTSTPLYSTAWTPTNTGGYAATCIFLVALASVFRGLLAAKAVAEARWLDAELRRRYVVVAGKEGLRENASRDSLSKRATLTENGVEEDVVVVAAPRPRSYVRPWRLSVDPLRAGIDVAIAGVGYLLMLAVMTTNVGYFLSILGGTYLGSLLAGRYAIPWEH